MGNRFTVGKKAFGFCDICAQRYALKKLKVVVVKTKPTNLLACPSCWDPDHPQLKLGMYPIDDPQALRTPRPDINIVESRDIQWGWNPVGGGNSFYDGGTPNPLAAQSGLGNVTVVTT